MKKKLILTCTIVFILWLVVLCISVIKTASTDMIGGADWPTFQFKLIQSLRSPFGIAVQLITISAVVFIIVLIIKNHTKRKNSN